MQGETGYRASGQDTTDEKLTRLLKQNVPSHRVFGYGRVIPWVADLSVTCESGKRIQVRVDTWTGEEMGVVECGLTVTGHDDVNETARRVQREYCSTPLGTVVPRNGA